MRGGGKGNPRGGARPVMVEARDYNEENVEAARSVLVELTHLLGEYRDHIVVIGGVPAHYDGIVVRQGRAWMNMNARDDPSRHRLPGALGNRTRNP